MMTFLGALTQAYSPTTETNPMQYDTQFSLSLISNTLGSIEPGPVTRYPDAYEKATSFFRNQYGVDISAEGSLLPAGAQLVTGSASSYVMNYAKVRGYPLLAGSQDIGVHDDTISVVLTQPAVVHGLYGGKNGTWVDGNSVLIFGFYTFFWKVNGTSVFPRSTFSGMMPMKIGADGSLIVDCELNSVVWGKGMARGIMLIRINPQTGLPYTTIVSSHTYQMSKTDMYPKCAVMTTEKEIFNDDFVVKWNNVLLSVIRDLKVAPPVASRQMAILHTAIDDALGSCRRLRFTSRKCSRSTLVSVISYAAHRVLSNLYPAQIDCFNAALKRALECKECKALSKSELAKIGKAGSLAADRILRCRDNDGSLDYVDYQYSNGPMSYQSHAPNFVRVPLLPQWPNVEPFAIQDVSNFDQGAPPQIGTPGFETAYNEVFTYGKNDSSVRTFDQRRIALFWADNAGTSSPPGHWNVILQSIIRKSNMVDTYKISAMFKVLTNSLADAAIVCWYHKYKYDAMRPVTAILNRNRNSNWFPFLATPPFPEYTSGHSTFSAAGARALSLVLGTDDISFDTISEGYVHHVRRFNKLSDAAKEAGKSRIYGGIHFEYANVAGYNSGVAVANAVYNQLCRNGSCLN